MKTRSTPSAAPSPGSINISWERPQHHRTERLGKDLEICSRNLKPLFVSDFWAVEGQTGEVPTTGILSEDQFPNGRRSAQKPPCGFPQPVYVHGQPRCSASLTLEVDLPCAHKTHFFQTFWYLPAYSFLAHRNDLVSRMEIHAPTCRGSQQGISWQRTST